MKKLALSIGLVLVLLVSVVAFGCAPEAKPPAEKPPAEKPPAEKPKPPEVKPITIRFSHVYSATPDSAPHVWLGKFQELCDKEMPGRIIAEEYPAAQLYKGVPGMKAAAAGAIEAGYWVDAYCGAVLPTEEGKNAFTATAFPIWKCPEHYYEFMVTYLPEMSKKYMEPLGVSATGIWCSYGTNYVSTKPLRKFADLEGVKARISPIPWLIQLIKLLGTVPMAIDVAEVPGALQSGTIDAACSVTSVLLRDKWYSMAPYMTPTGVPGINAMGGWWWNLKFLNGLPDDVRANIEKIIPQVDAYVEDTISLPINHNWIEIFSSDGAKPQEWSPEELAKVQQALQPLYDTYKDKPGSKWTLEKAAEMGKKYTPEYIEELAKKYRGVKFPPGFEDLAKK